MPGARDLSPLLDDISLDTPVLAALSTSPEMHTREDSYTAVQGVHLAPEEPKTPATAPKTYSHRRHIQERRSQSEKDTLKAVVAPPPPAPEATAVAPLPVHPERERIVDMAVAPPSPVPESISVDVTATAVAPLSVHPEWECIDDMVVATLPTTPKSVNVDVASTVVAPPPVHPDQERVVDMAVAPSAPTSSPSANARTTFISFISTAITSVLPTPSHSHRMPSAPLHRSCHLVGVGAEFSLDPEPARCKKHVMRTLEVIRENEGIHDAALDKYTKLFSQPLSEDHLFALACLF